MIYQTLEVDVTQKHIDEGGTQSDNCPVYLALRDSCPNLFREYRVLVYETNIMLNRRGENVVIHLEVPLPITDFIQRNDRAKGGFNPMLLHPIRFKIKIPETNC